MITIDALYADTAVERLSRAGFTKVKEMPVDVAIALAALSDEELKSLQSAQKSGANKVTNIHGFAIF